ncbi:hypothetical protein O181_059348 [Austropuccinia psidii MF-1]|uniref:Uncharacterized protein n=1 Tax=Austropuccinia psidii MF-1 TaxID=1389203 RepID=A0A9Q3EEP2_9BASI|nr:hypothetical protein [Austropuccinia psidii MF-1]
MESKIIPNTSREDGRPERPVLKCHKCKINSNLAKNCINNPKINKYQVIEELHCTEEKEESEKDYEISDDIPQEDYPIKNLTGFSEVTEVHHNFPQFSEDFYKLINIQDSKACKTKPA